MVDDYTRLRNLFVPILVVLAYEAGIGLATIYINWLPKDVARVT
jgi:hypothetical protein